MTPAAEKRDFAISIPFHGACLRDDSTTYSRSFRFDSHDGDTGSEPDAFDHSAA
jgi:hypothetical protein